MAKDGKVIITCAGDRVDTNADHVGALAPDP